jgi:metallo-beta-lactamase family protein
LVDQKKIPNIPVYIDSPLAVNMTSIFMVHPELFDEDMQKEFIEKHESPFNFNNLNYITGTEDSKKLNSMKEPMIIVSSSGMCEAGRILHHLKNNIENPNNAILIVGYMAENTLGRKIADKEKQVKIFDEFYDLRAQVYIFDAFSAHADYNEIKDYLLRLNYKKIKKVFLVHGEKDAQDNLCKVIKGIGITEAEAIKYGSTYILD